MIKPASLKSKWLAGLILVAMAALLIGGSCAANVLPVISSLSLTSQGEINPGATVHLECDATDPDEDELSYTWSADEGIISSSGANAIWTAPDTVGTYIVSVEVSDGRDGIATDQLTIAVLAPNNPPVIESLTTDCPRVKQSHSAILTCVASDPDGDELNYSWSAERGSIDGEDAEVTWVGPNEFGTFVITLTVSDGRGGEASSEISIIVCSCGSAC
jgi:chitinase